MAHGDHPGREWQSQDWSPGIPVRHVRQTALPLGQQAVFQLLSRKKRTTCTLSPPPRWVQRQRSGEALGDSLTSLPPAKSAMRVELECRQIWCSPGVCEVKVKRPSEPYCRDRTTWNHQRQSCECQARPTIPPHSASMLLMSLSQSKGNPGPAKPAAPEIWPQRPYQREAPGSGQEEDRGHTKMPRRRITGLCPKQQDESRQGALSRPALRPPAALPFHQDPSLPRACPAPAWRAGTTPTACPTAACGNSLHARDGDQGGGLPSYP